jgi:hypothetical protein
VQARGRDGCKGDFGALNQAGFHSTLTANP